MHYAIDGKRMENFDVVIVGAGVVGLAIAASLSKEYEKVLLVDKNGSFGEETSSRNSEVIHAGIYYPKNSLKAKLCVEGKIKLYKYCQDHRIPHKKVGKLLVAHDDIEEEFLSKTIDIAANNGVNDLQWQSSSQLSALEPALSATAALLSPSTGIIDVHSYMQSLLNQFEQNGGIFVAQTEVLSIERESNSFDVSLVSVQEEMKISAKRLVNCGGLHSTKLANNMNFMPKRLIPKLHYCRGHYFSYSGKSPFNHLIYPVPEANGLGIHASLDTGGQLKFGPDTQYIEQLDYRVDEELKDKFYHAIQKYFPAITPEKLQPAYSGIRPKLQGENDGFRDFVIQTGEKFGIVGLVQLFGIDSPGLTSSLAIAEYVKNRLKGE